MLNATGILKYSLEGKPLTELSLKAPLDKQYRNKVTLYPHRSVILFNSTFVEVMDRWNYTRGLVALYASIGLMMMCGGVPVIVYFTIFGKLPIGLILLGLILTPVFLVGTYGVWRLFNSEVFSFTHYPLRFNRALRKVYVTQSNRKQYSYDWDKIHFSIERSNDEHDVRGHYVNDAGIIERVFALPFADAESIDSELLIGHWEFIRRYMEDDDISDVHATVTELYPISKKKESFALSVKRVYLWRVIGHMDDDTPSTVMNVFFYATFLFWVLIIIGRRYSMLTCWVPKWPATVEAECVVAQGDKFDMTQFPKPALTHAKAALPVRILSTAVYIVLGIISIYLAAGFFDVLAAVKGHHPHVLRHLMFWLK